MWKGIVGEAYDVEGFKGYVEGITLGVWRPRFVVVHNTSAPDLAAFAKWEARGSPSDAQWMQNLQGYYRDQLGWSAGPHVFVTPRSICAFTPLSVPGVHSPSWNSISWGVETVGEFESEAFDGPVRENLIATLGILHSRAGLSVLPYVCGQSGLHFHKEDVHTSHRTCPGKNMDKARLVSDVMNWIYQDSNNGDHTPTPSSALTS